MEAGRRILIKQNRQSMLRSLRCNWQGQRRRKKQLLIIAVEEHGVLLSCWQADCCLLQKERTLEQAWQEGCVAWWQELEEALKDVLIWARVPDMVDTLLLVQEELVFGEELRLPQMEEQELYQAIQWEAEQLVPWPQGSYNTAFATQSMEQEELVQLWAWPREQARWAGELCYGLRLHLQGIVVGIPTAKLQQAWYQGVNLQNWSLTSSNQQWEQRLEHWATSRFPQAVCLGCVLLALLLHACARGGCYFAQKHLAATEQELAHYELWQQRLVESQRWETALQRYQHLAKQLEANSSHMGRSLSALGQQVSAGCWLENLTCSDARAMDHSVGRAAEKNAVGVGTKLGGKGSRTPTWQVAGACHEQVDLERFMVGLENSRQFTRVQLQHSQQQQGRLKFALTVQEK